MGIKYTSQTTSTYADDTPPDDGSQTEGNRVSINLIRTNYTDPIKNLADSINTAIVDYFSVPTRTATGTTSTLATDHGTMIQCNGTFTITLIAAATATAGYEVTIVNVGSGNVTVAVQTGETLNGTTNGTFALAARESAVFKCLHEETGYVVTSSYQESILATDIIANTITASGNVGIGGTLSVVGAADFTSIVANTVTASGNVGIGGTLTVAGTSALAGVTATSIVANTVTASGNVGIGGTLTVTGVSTLGNVIANDITASGTIVAGSLIMQSGSITDTSGAIDFGNENLSTDGKVDYQRFEEDVYAIGTDVSVATTISFSNGSTQTITITGNATLTFAGEPASGQFGSILLIVTVSGGSFSPTLAYGGGTEKTPFGDAIAWTGTNGAIDIVTVFTIDGGTTFYVSPFIMAAA